MLKKSVLILLIVLSLATVKATSIETFDYNTTKMGVNMTSNVTELYAYEINFDYTGTSATIQQYNFLGPTNIATYGSNIKNNILSVYGSRLDSNRLGVNGSGMLFNISHSGTGGLDLRYTLEIYANGSELYTYYNNSAQDNNQEEGSSGSSSGAGGGGGAPTTASEISITPDLLKLELVEGRTLREKIKLTNLKAEQIQINDIDLGEIGKFVASYVPQEPLYIPQNDFLEISFDFFARKDIRPEVYTGEIKFITSTSTHSLPVVLEVVEEQPLFDVVTALEKDEYAPGEIVMATIDIQNFGDLKDIDVIVHYAIKNFDGEELIFEEGSYAIENYKLQLIGKLRVPRDAVLGDKYIFYAQVTYPAQNISASASSVFTVNRPQFSPLGGVANLFFLILIPLAVVAIIIVTVVIIFNVTKKKDDSPLPQNPALS